MRWSPNLKSDKLGVEMTTVFGNTENWFGFNRHVSCAKIHFQSDRDAVVFLLCGVNLVPFILI